MNAQTRMKENCKHGKIPRGKIIIPLRGRNMNITSFIRLQLP